MPAAAKAWFAKWNWTTMITWGGIHSGYLMDETYLGQIITFKFFDISKLKMTNSNPTLKLSSAHEGKRRRRRSKIAKD